jgi:hypothetical protein
MDNCSNSRANTCPLHLLASLCGWVCACGVSRVFFCVLHGTQKKATTHNTQHTHTSQKGAHSKYKTHKNKPNQQPHNIHHPPHQTNTPAHSPGCRLAGAKKPPTPPGGEAKARKCFLSPFPVPWDFFVLCQPRFLCCLVCWRTGRMVLFVVGLFVGADWP